MQLTEIECGECAFFATWTDNSVTELPFNWLDDNDNAELHPETRERVFDLTGVSLDLQPESYQWAEFDPPSGKRHYRGFYIDYNEVDSLIRVLSLESEDNGPG
jgi:hypothetical protein